jgi:GNAT superfamily N-acetyltransferase
MSPSRFPLVDIGLSRQFERAEAHANRRFVESRARQQPEVGACWIEAGGAYAMFDGVGSPTTQTFGLGVFEPVTGATLDVIEPFFTSRGSDVFHEVSPLAEPATLLMLSDRGYRPCELTSILFQPLPSKTTLALPASSITARLSGPDEVERWAELAKAGWSDFPEFREFMAEFTAVATGTEDAHRFLAFDGDTPIATGSLSVHGSVALLAGASTVPEARGRGAQRMLLAARLGFAASLGCTLATMGAAPGSRSQKNAERSGFHIAYTRIKWARTTW